MAPKARDDPRDAFFSTEGLRRDLGRKTGLAARTTILNSVLRLFVTVGTTAILARLVSPAEHGLVALAIPIVLIGSGLSEFGLSQAIVQRENVTHRLVSALFWINVLLGLVMAGLVAFAGPLAGEFYRQPEVVPVFLALSPYVLLTVINTQYVAILRRQLRVPTIELASMVALVLASAVAIAAAFAGFGPYAIVVQMLSHQFFTFLLLFLAVRWLPSPPWLARLSETGASLRFGAYLAADRLLGDVTNSLQILAIGRAFADAQVGIYYRTEAIALMANRRIAVPLAGIFIAALSRLQGEPEEFRAMFARQVSRGNLLFAPIGIVMCTCADGIVLVLLGPDWNAATPILQILSLFPMFLLSVSSFGWAVVACGRSEAMLYSRILLTLATIGALILAIPHGVPAIAGAQVFVQIPFNGVVLGSLAIASTPLSAAGVTRGILSNAGFIAVGLGGGFVMRELLELHLLVECLLVGIAVVLFVSFRTMLDADMRSDVTKLLLRR